MVDRIPTVRLSRRGAIQLMTVMAAAALVPLGSIAAAQSTSPSGNEPQPTNRPASGSSSSGNRFSPPPSPSPSPSLAPSSASSPTSGIAPSAYPTSEEDAEEPGQTVPAANQSAPASGQTTPAAQGTPTAGAQATAGSWVQNHRTTELWSGPDEKAVSFGWAPVFSYFKVLGAQEGSRFRVQNPLTNGVAYVTANDVGPSGTPPEWYLSQKGQQTIPARIVGGANIRSTPSTEADNIVGRAGHNESVGVIGEVKGADGDTWYRIGPNEMVHGSLVRVPAKFPAHPGKLIVAELADPCIVTAYEDGKAVYSTLSLKGTIAWATPTGFFTILRRVENEIMSSEGLGIPRDAPGGYYLKNVLYTQYFTNDGASIHYNYWSSNWGYSGSHGCLGMSYDDSLWFWQWADIGTPIAIQERRRASSRRVGR